MAGRELPPSSPFAGDAGRADPALAAALVSGELTDVVAALRSARVLVPVLARVEAEAVAHGLRVDKEASTGVVALRAPDGRTALPVFSDLERMSRWRAAARPVAAEGPRAAAAAVQEGWEVLVVDPADDAVLVPRPAVVALATGAPWLPAVVGGRVDEDVRTALAAVVEAVPGVVQADVVPGRRAEVAVVLRLAAGADRSAADTTVAAAGAALAASAVVRDRVDSVELRPLARAG